MSEQSFERTPPDWKTATLGEVSECILGGTPSTDKPLYWNGDIPWMTSGDVHIRRIWDVSGRISGLGLRSSNATLTNPPAVAVGLAGQGKTRGTVALTQCTLCTNQSIALLKANDIDLRTDYLFHNLDRRYEELRARSSGGGRGGLSKAILEAVPIDLPPISEQSKIVRILDTLDTAIHETEAIIVKLKAVKQGLLHDLLTRGIDANGELRPTQAEAPHLYKESPLGWSPKEWECVSLEEKLAVLGGKRLPAGHAYADNLTGFKYLRVTDFIGRRYSVDDLLNLHEKTFNALERYEIKPGQLYISIAGSIGHVGVHKLSDADDVRTVLTENATRLVPLCEMSPEFVAAYMNTEMVQKQVNAEKGTGGGVPKLALFRIQKFNLAWPSKIEQDRISERILVVEARFSVEESLLEKLKRQKAGFMDDLLTGRVRVTPLLTAEQQGGA